MEILIWIGAAVSLLGVFGLLYCVMAALRLRKAGVDEATARLGMQRVVIINMAALGISALGLMMVVLGIFLK